MSENKDKDEKQDAPTKDQLSVNADEVEIPTLTPEEEAVRRL